MKNYLNKAKQAIGLGEKKPLTKQEAIDTKFDVPICTIPGTGDRLSTSDFLTGCQLWGATGSGKTSGVGKFILIALLRQFIGFLVLCAKPTDLRMWERLLKMVGRDDDLVVFGKDRTDSEGRLLGFNILEFEMHRNGPFTGSTLNIVDLLMKVYEAGRNFMSGGSEGGGGGAERFWSDGTRRMCGNMIDLLRLARRQISFTSLRALCIDLPQKAEVDRLKSLLAIIYSDQSDDNALVSAQQEIETWRGENFFVDCYVAIAEKIDTMSDDDYRLYDEVDQYFLKIAPRIPDETRVIFIESLLGLIEPFTKSEILRKHFSDHTSPEILPDQIINNGRILFMDFAIKEHKLGGLYAQVLMKLFFQQEMERRDLEQEEDPKAAVLWVDEAHLFINPEYDAEYQSTSRSCGAITVYITQNLPSYLVAMRGNSAMNRTQNLLGNMNIQAFCSQGEGKTNTYASDLIGKQYIPVGGGRTENENGDVSTSSKMEYQYSFLPVNFTQLRMGRKENNYQVDCVIFKTGRLWKDGKNYIQTFFDQRDDKCNPHE